MRTARAIGAADDKSVNRMSLRAMIILREQNVIVGKRDYAVNDRDYAVNGLALGREGLINLRSIEWRDALASDRALHPGNPTTR